MGLGAYDAARVAVKLQIPPVTELSRNNNLFGSFIFQLLFFSNLINPYERQTPD